MVQEKQFEPEPSLDEALPTSTPHRLGVSGNMARRGRGQSNIAPTTRPTRSSKQKTVLRSDQFETNMQYTFFLLNTFLFDYFYLI
jgi:hypothetical protein